MHKKGIRRREFIAMITAIVMSIVLVVVAASGLHRTNQVITQLESKSLPDIRVALGLAEGVAQLAAFAPYAASITQPSLLEEQNVRLNSRFDRLLSITDEVTDTSFRATLTSKLKSIEQSAIKLSEITSQNLFLSEELLSQYFQLELSSEPYKESDAFVSENIEILVNLLASKEEARLKIVDSWLAELNNDQHNNAQTLNTFLKAARDIVKQKLTNDSQKQFLLISIRVQSEQLSNFVNQYVNSIQERVFEQQQVAQERISQVFWAMVVVMLLLIIAVATNYGINIKIVQDLVNVTDDMTRLSNGDTRKVSKFRLRNDEVGELLSAYQVFRTYTYRIQKVSSDLEQQKQLLESIFNGMHDGLSVYSKENKLLAWNNQYFSALNLSEKEIHPGMSLERVLELIKKTGGQFKDIGGNKLDIKQWVLSRHSEDRCVEWCANDGRVIEFRSQPMSNGGFITLVQDLTYRRETELQLQQAVKMESLGQLTGGVSHDFNNFLTSILGNLELLEMQQELSQNSRKFLSRALKATENGQGLVHKLLAFSRKQELYPEVLCIEALIKETEELLDYSVSENVDLILSLSEQSHFIKIDRIQFQNALLNLTINANGAISEKGNITISTELQNSDGCDWLTVSVSDTGKGIPKAIQDKVFEAFFTTKEVGSGSGLGLSSVHGYVEQSGGRIGIKSEPAEGTVIWMKWPIAECQPPVVDMMELSATESTFMQGTVVLIEDDEQVAQTMLDVLATRVENLVHFPVADVAIEWIEHHSDTVNLVLSDVHLVNSVSGVELKQHLAITNPELPVYLYSGMAKEAIESQFDSVLDSQFISKPVSMETIDLILRSILNK